MSYFKENPKALLDAIPTPRGDEEKALKDFKSGLTPKADMSFRFNDTSSSGFGFKPKLTSGFGNYIGNSNGINTPSKRL